MQPIERELVTSNWVTLLFLFSIVLIFLLKLFSETKVKGHAFSVFNKGFLEIEAEEKESFFSVFHIIYTLFSFIVISLTLFFFLENYKGNTGEEFVEYVFLASLLASYMLMRFSIEFLLVKLLQIRRIVSFFVVSKRSSLYSISIGLCGVLLIYYYGFKEIWILIYAVILLFGLRLLLLLINNKNLILNKLFYFILYLCAFEIAPMLILLKLVILE